MIRLFAVVVALALGGCQTDGIQKSLPQICSGAEYAHAAFSVYVLSGKAPARYVQSEAIAYGTLSRICADPANASNAAILVSATSAALQISLALQAAEKGS